MADDITLTSDDLIDRLTDNLPAGYTTATYSKPNAPFDTPKGTKWLKVQVETDTTNNVAAGGGYKRTFGTFTVNIFYPKNTGNKAAIADANTIKQLYENQRFGNTSCEESSINIVGSGDTWYLVQVLVSFNYEGV